jgi:hypothetical protein
MLSIDPNVKYLTRYIFVLQNPNVKYQMANHFNSSWVVVDADCSMLSSPAERRDNRKGSCAKSCTKIHIAIYIATAYIPKDFWVQIRIELYCIYSEQDPYYNCTLIHRKLIT